MSAQVVNHKVAAYAAEIAAALEPLRARDCGFGEFYIAGVRLGFDGEDVGIEIIPDEFDGLSVRVSGSPA